MRHGSCLCGAVTYRLDGDLPAPNACHCTQCRKQSGHYWASSDVEKDRLQINGGDNLRWYQASDKVRRGFCKTCGSFLFWEPLKGAKIAVAMGSMDQPTHTQLAVHIFTGDKGDYYKINDGLPQNET